MNKKTNESCWWRRTWRWGTWEKLINASEADPSQAGKTACFYTEHKPVKLALSLSLCVVSPLNLSSCNTCVLFQFLTYSTCVKHYQCVCVCLCDGVQSSERPPRQYVVVHGQTVRNDPGLVTGSGQGCWRLTLSFLCAWCQAHPSPFTSSSHVCSSNWLPILSFHVAFFIFVLWIPLITHRILLFSLSGTRILT